MRLRLGTPIKKLLTAGFISPLCLCSLLLIYAVYATNAQALTLDDAVAAICADTCGERAHAETATLILDRGQTALYTRAWLAEHAQQSIDVQYFIWSEDNIGILAMAALLQAAERGLKVRIIVDDFLIDADLTTLLALESHPNIAIKVYNPQHKVGVSTFQRIKNIVFDFRGANQRMHDKVALFDGTVAITGGRNMADEYFDFDREYSFRDRDVLVYGKAVGTIKASFERFWQHELAVSIAQLLQDKLAELNQHSIENAYENLIAYANNPANFEPEVRDSIKQLSTQLTSLLDEFRWSDAYFIYDLPGKNDGQSGLKGGGQSTQKIYALINQATSEILIQSPYLVVPQAIIERFKTLIASGVSIKISTNSLASTDNLMAYSGYHKIRTELLQAGVELYEYKPAPENQQRLHQGYLAMKDSPPIFALHAKSMVIDKKIAAIGTFNFDPRSINLNTEVGVVIPDIASALELHQLISDDIKPGNSWRISEHSNPDSVVSFNKKLKLWFYKILPLDAVL